jgi:hypothetical protein
MALTWVYTRIEPSRADCYAATLLIIAKLITTAAVSAVAACKLLSVISKVPAATAVTFAHVDPDVDPPDFTQHTTTSLAATALFVTVKVISAPAARDVESVVIVPHIHGLGTIVTAVALVVIWVTAPPAPVAYPIPCDAPLLVIALFVVIAPLIIFAALPSRVYFTPCVN